jgi:hypothetical protein
MTIDLRKIFILSSVIWVFMGHAAFGEETTATQFPDRLKIWGGYQYLFGLDANIRLDGSKTNFGTSVDWEDDLDGDTTDSMVRAGIRWRFTPKHAIGFSYYDMDFDGDGRLDQNFQIDDTIFQVGGRTESDLDLALFRFFYTYSFYRSEKAELSLSPGIYLADFDAKIKGTLTIAPGDLPTASRSRTVKESELAPLPTVGFAVDYKIFPRLTATLKADYFYIEINDIEGSLAELFIGLEYRVLKHLGVGTSFNRMWFDIDWKSGKSNGWEVDGTWNGVMAYAALYF